ncbi:hypothetical protein [Nocardioides aequoreus]|uniref:hypothetical protein n=1 Tax=Nocardioides aequoreus TaxID=397278 RepID=UPI0004C432FC|nr:hypothetical protein [Nocardioides aequoreus]
MPVVEALFEAPPASVVAVLTSALPAQGWRLTGIGGFGSVVTWQAFDRDLELVSLRAEVLPDEARPELTRLRVQVVDAGLATALDAALTSAPVQSARLPRRPSAAG